MATDVIWQTDLAIDRPRRTGKVRDLYDFGDHLLIVACDRISAFDHVLQPGVPGKGKILHQLTNFWFDRLKAELPNHIVATEVTDFPTELAPHADVLRGRSAWVKKAQVIPFECVARGFLAGSGFKDYTRSGKVCGIELPTGLKRASRLPEPIFTPATKAEVGHDENVDFDYMASEIGLALATRLRSLTLELYRTGAELAETRGLILADTKFEFGLVDGEVMLIDEALTPDSSRYWDAELWQPGEEPASFDKQYVRNWLDSDVWDQESAPPELPDEVIAGTLERYREAFRRITGAEPRLD